MAESRYNRLDNQSPVQTQLDNSDLNVPRSAFDFSTIHSGNALIGALIPVDCFDVVPNESISISMSNLIEFRNPTTRQLLNGMRIYFHCYYNKLTDLWEGAKNFLDCGRTGQISLTRPNLRSHIYDVDYSVVGTKFCDFSVDACTPMSLLNYLGMPARCIETVDNSTSLVKPLSSFKSAFQVDNSDTSGPTDDKSYLTILSSSHSEFFPADCAFAYQRNWRDFYANKNLLQNNKYWFPDNEDHFILSYNCEVATALFYENEDFQTDNPILSALFPTASIRQAFNIYGTIPTTHSDNLNNYKNFTPEPNNPATYSRGTNLDYSIFQAPNLSGLKFRQFRGDRFSTSLPFPDLIRGDVPIISLTEESLARVHQGNNPLVFPFSLAVESPNEIPPHSASLGVYNLYNDTGSSFSLDSGLDNQLFVNIPASQLTMNAIRELETLTVFKERMARTNGDYNDMIEAQYGYNPHVHDRKGTYVGGFYQDFAFSSVTQMSESTSNSPLGQKAGQGVSSGSGTICNNFHVSDFGWIQIYMSIVPDVFYTQGKPRMFDKKVQTDMYFPLFNNLAPQYIKNKELFISGTEAADNGAFGYEDRYAEYKSRPNRVSGFMALSPEIAAYDTARVMARRFTSTPALNNNFVSMVPENIDMSVFSVVDEPPFDFSCGISVRRVAPMPYTAVPGSMSSGIHS